MINHSQRPFNTRLAIGCVLFVASAAAEPAIRWNQAAARHLLSRTSFHADPDVAARLAALPLETAVKQLLDTAEQATPPTRPDWVREDWRNMGRRWSDMSREEYLMVLRRNGTRNAAELNQLRAWWLQQLISTDTPLREQMTLFWHGHFTSSSGKVLSFAQSFYEQNQTWRKHALGNFREYLEAATLDPCMLNYLDLERSDKAHPNENYARELLELFTLGVGNYTEKDILEIARALTGWSLDAPEGSVVIRRPTDPERLRFPSITRDGMAASFHADKHDNGPKTIFGKTGNFGLTDVLDMIVAHPACGRHLATRMIDYFGVKDPEGRLRDRLATTFTSSGYEIRPMVEQLLTSPEFYADASRGNRIKSPVRLLVGACRDLRLDVAATPSLAALMVPMGQELFNPPTVKGWSGGSAWVSASTLALRYRLGEALIDGREVQGTEPLGRLRLTPVPADAEQAAAQIKRLVQIDLERKQDAAKDGIRVTFQPERLVNESASPAQLMDRLSERMLMVAPRSLTREAILQACEQVSAAERPAVVARLLLASPEYQLE